MTVPELVLVMAAVVLAYWLARMFPVLLLAVCIVILAMVGGVMELVVTSWRWVRGAAARPPPRDRGGW